MPKTKLVVCICCENTRVRVPILEPVTAALCTDLYFYCPKCETYYRIQDTRPE